MVNTYTVDVITIPYQQVSCNMHWQKKKIMM